MNLFLFCFLVNESECISALEGRAVVNLQMSDTFAALMDINQAIKVWEEAIYYYDSIQTKISIDVKKYTRIHLLAIFQLLLFMISLFRSNRLQNFTLIAE